MTTSTTENMLTALCVWEEMLEAHDRGDCATMDNVWDNLGSWEMRQGAIDVAPQFDALWDKLNGDEAALDGMAFDWEFIPFLLPYVSWVGCAGGWTVSDEGLAEMVMAEHARLIASTQS
jgi:hypothetical protein